MTLSTLPRRPLTVDDLDEFPDDGHRYELIDGVLIVSPPPAYLHQILQSNLMAALVEAATPDRRVLAAPVGVELGPHTSVEPDLLVVPRHDTGPNKLTERPVLVIEILSPSSRRTDFWLKRTIYEERRIPSYWMADPDEPGLTVLELGGDGRYAETARASGEASLEVERPFPVQIVPAELVL